MSTRSIIVVTGREKHRDTGETIRLYQHSDGYPTGVLPEIHAGLKRAIDLCIEHENLFGDKSGPDRFTAELVAHCIVCASVTVYGPSARIDDDNGERAEYEGYVAMSHFGNQSDLEWIYLVNLETRSIGVYGGGFSGDSPQVVVARGTVDPASYADKLKSEYQENERKNTRKLVQQLEELGFYINPTGSKKNPEKRSNKGRYSDLNWLGIADFMSNAIEHSTEEGEAEKHLSKEFGLTAADAKKLVREWFENKMQLDLKATSLQVYQFIAGVLGIKAPNKHGQVDNGEPKKKANKPSADALKAFKEYFLSFYGRGQMYQHFFGKPPTQKEIDRAIEIRLESPVEFVGDTLDRERVRDIILTFRGEHALVKKLGEFG